MDIFVTVLIILLAIVIFLFAFVLIRTSLFLRAGDMVEPVDLPEVDDAVIAEHVAAAVRCPTVSQSREAEPDPVAFKQLHYALESLYPRVHSTLEIATISDFSLLYTWRGSNPELPAVVFCGHLDVVPADPASLEQWEHPPFSGDIADEYVWGRGTLDNKMQVVSLLYAAEQLIRQGFQPERTIYLAFGHDEEIGGEQGAKKIAAYLEKREEQFDIVLDEGGAMVLDILPGVDAPVALVGTAEKGFLNVRLSVERTGGHSSAPPPSTAIGILSRAITSIEDRPLPVRLAAIRTTYRALGAAVSPWMQMVFANSWLFGGILRKKLQSSPQSNATVRTTTAVTVVKGGIKDNILPPKAEALVNFRLFPGDSIAKVCEHVRDAVDDRNVEIEAQEGSAWEASPVTPSDSTAFESLSRVIRQVFPGVEVAPYLVLGATDARHYCKICTQVLRFTPLVLEKEDLERMHGVNERVSTAALGRMVQFFIYLMREWAGGAADTQS